jgi:hypothetical protein
MEGYMSWQELEERQPELATFGVERLNRKIAYLATVDREGSPRVHPITPIIGQGHLLVFMEPTSPKGHDLRRNGRYALHCAVSDSSGSSGEFVIRGSARLVDDAGLRLLAEQLAGYKVVERYILFEFEIESAASTIYPDEQPVRHMWKRDE